MSYSFPGVHVAICVSCIFGLFLSYGVLCTEPSLFLSKLCRFMNLPYPSEETLARHSILGPNGLHGRWNVPITGIKV